MKFSTVLSSDGNSQRFATGFRQCLAIIFVALIFGIFSHLLYPSGLPFLNPFNTDSNKPQNNGKIHRIPIQEAWDFYQKKQVLFLDGRDPWSFREGHIPGAMNVPPGEVKASISIIRTKEKECLRLITYCDGEACPLGEELAEALQKEGIGSVYVLVNGWSRWRTQGYPLKKEANP
jgi:rhodanese-related sulfurtransferase